MKAADIDIISYERFFQLIFNKSGTTFRIEECSHSSPSKYVVFLIQSFFLSFITTDFDKT